MSVKCTVCGVAKARRPSAKYPICEGCHHRRVRRFAFTPAQLREEIRRRKARIHFELTCIRTTLSVLHGIESLGVYNPRVEEFKPPDPVTP